MSEAEDLIIEDAKARARRLLNWGLVFFSEKYNRDERKRDLQISAFKKDPWKAKAYGQA
jgi:hypothetical protein